MRWDCIGIGGTLHVFSSVFDMLFMSVSSEEHAFNHCISVKLLLIVKIEVRKSIRIVFSSKKSVVK